MTCSLPCYSLDAGPPTSFSSITVHYPWGTLDVTIWLHMHAMNFSSTWNAASHYKRFCYEQIACTSAKVVAENITNRPTTLDSQWHLQRYCFNTFWAGEWIMTVVRHSAVYIYIHTCIHTLKTNIHTHQAGSLRDCAGAANTVWFFRH